MAVMTQNFAGFCHQVLAQSHMVPSSALQLFKKIKKSELRLSVFHCLPCPVSILFSSHRIIFDVVSDPTSEHRGRPKVRRHVRRLAPLKHHWREH